MVQRTNYRSRTVQKQYTARQINKVANRLEEFLLYGHGRYVRPPTEHELNLLLELRKKAKTRRAQNAIHERIQALRNPKRQGLPTKEIQRKALALRKKTGIPTHTLPKNQVGFNRGWNMLLHLEKSATTPKDFEVLAYEWAELAYTFYESVEPIERKKIGQCLKKALQAAKDANNRKLIATIKKGAQVRGLSLK